MQTNGTDLVNTTAQTTAWEACVPVGELAAVLAVPLLIHLLASAFWE